jgi:hypothetical protein
MTARRLVLLSLLAVLALAGCGGSSSTSTSPLVQPASIYSLAGFKPAGIVRAGQPTAVSFVIRQPDGTALTKFKTGPGPHTGVHLIFVRRDLAYMIHHHPSVAHLAAGGAITDSVTFPAPGPYRLVVDVYPAGGSQPNFQLFGKVTVAGTYKPKALPPPGSTVEAGGYRFVLSGASDIKALQASIVTVTVTDSHGRLAHFVPWYGALAHAIFFRRGSLDYFHTHVCAPGVSNCTSILGPAKVSGTSSTPGKLHVGVLTDAPGTWRLFLQCELGGRVVTAPFTLDVT